MVADRLNRPIADTLKEDCFSFTPQPIVCVAHPGGGLVWFGCCDDLEIGWGKTSSPRKP